MLPLRILGFLCLIFSQCGTESTCPSHLDPLILEPAGVVEAYGNTLSVKCSTTVEEHDAIYWVVGDIVEDEDNDYVYHNLSLSDYNMTAQCRIKLNESHECSKDLEITVYNNPEVVSSIKRVSAEGEVTRYDLQCDVFKVAPVQNLVVRWYKNNEIAKTSLFNSTTKTPGDETVTLPVNISRSDHVVQLRCEAQLDFGPRGEQLPVVSQTLNISAQYAPEMKPDNSLRRIFVTEGENVTLNCDAEGNPPPVFSWTCDGVDMFENTNNLTFAPVPLESTCICRAANYLGNVTEEYDIYIIQSVIRTKPPTQTTPEAQTERVAACPLTLTPPRIVAEFGGPVWANCSTSVPDAVRMGWESPVKGTQVRYPLQISWTVEKLELWDLKLLCYITLNNDHQCTVPLDISVYKLPDRVLVFGPGNDLIEGKEYKLTCLIEGVVPVNMLTVFWYRDDQELVSRNLFNITKKPDSVADFLTITAQRDQQGSKFRCAVVLDLGSNEPQSFLNTTSTSVYKPVVQYKPFFKSCPSHYDVVEDSHSLNNFSCQVDGNPPPTVQWYYEGEAFSSSKPLGRNDSGTYTMEIANRNGRSNTSVEITVEYPPFIACDLHHEVKLNPHIQIPCEFGGLPSPTVTWFKDGEKMVHWTKYDSGEYRLEARNAHGSAVNIIYLDILYAPEIKEGNHSVEVIQGENVTLDCSAEGNPPPEVVWSFTSGVPSKETTEWSQKTITVTAATSTSAAVYSCSATNKVGKATRTVSLVIQDKSRGFKYNPIIWVVLIILAIIVLLVLVVLFQKRHKKHGQYSFVPSKAGSNIPLSALSPGGSP